MTRSLGGRTRTQRTRVRDFPKRGMLVTPPQSPCLSESFDGADWPIGADQTWEEGHFGSKSPSGSSTSDGVNPLARTLHVVDNKLTIQAPDDSLLAGGENWFRAIGYARVDTELAGPDMQVTATIGGVTAGNGTPEWILIVRSEPDAQETFSTGFIKGWVFYFNAPDYVFVEPIWITGPGTASPGILASGFTDTATVNPTFTWTAVEGEQIRVTATGTGDATEIVAEAPIGNVAMTLNLANDWGNAFDLISGTTSADFAVGAQAGAGLFVQNTSFGGAWNHAAWDDVLTLDDWEACAV